MDQAKIEVNNLYKIFNGKKKREISLLENGLSKDDILEKTGATVAVNKANFKVMPGEIFVIMGLSGSGKSTLLRCLNRLIEPSKGTVKIDGQDITKLNSKELRNYRRQKYGMVFQNFALFPYRTVQANAEFGLEIQGVSANIRKAKAASALETVGLSGYEQQKPNQLSGGMQQRVGLARALAVDPDILLMDEPFSALDPLIKKEMQDMLLDLYQQINKTIIFITHDLDEALKLGDRIAIMKDGEIVQIGNHEEILNQAENDYVAEFVQDVNRSRVLTAADIMSKPVALLYPQAGLKTALHKMRQNKLASIFVLGKEHKVKGIVKIKNVVSAINDGQQKLKDLIEKVPTASPGETVNSLFAKIAELDTPIPVLNEKDQLKGVIVKTDVIANLATDQI